MKNQSTDALILCGGLGTRLQPVISNIPKGMATVGQKPFLELQVDFLKSLGVRRVVFCVGHLKEAIVEHFSDFPGIECEFSVEDTPLGTGGAIKNAWSLVRSETALVLNGDSFCKFDLKAFYNFHSQHQGLCSILLSEVLHSQDYGSVLLDQETGRISSFNEKQTTSGKGYVNAGVYLFSQQVQESWPQENQFSLEKEFFPHLIDNKNCFGFVGEGSFHDIGTPERYQDAQKFIHNG